MNLKSHPPSPTPFDRLPPSPRLRRIKWRTRNPRAKSRRVNFSTSALLHLLVLLLFQFSCSDPPLSPSPPRPLDDAPPRRIVSLAPSITEVLFRLDQGSRVVGVTRYCDYPPEATEKPVVGGYFDVNYEMLLSLEPDLVILLKEHQDAVDRLAELGVRTLTVDHSRVQGIIDSFGAIGAQCGPEAASKASDLEEWSRWNIGLVSKAVDGLPRPKVMIAVGRLMDKGSGGEIFISGRDGFYDDLLTLAGGINSYRQETLKLPAISDEGLIRLDPDVVLEMVPDLSGDEDRSSLMELWRSKTGIRAVEEGRVYILGQDYVVVPGPRFVYLLKDMAELIHGIKIRE